MPKIGRKPKVAKKDVKFYSTTVNQRGHKITKNGEALAWVVTHIRKQTPLQITIDQHGNVEVHANGWPVKVVEDAATK